MAGSRRFGIRTLLCAVVVCAALAALARAEEFTLREALQTEGLSEAAWEPHLTRFEFFSQELRAALDAAASPRSVFGQAQVVHEFLHCRVLRGDYNERASSVADALAGGSFNCAAASGIYVLLAKAVHLPAHAVAVPGHVWCRVESDRQTLDIEATSPIWFELLASETDARPEAAQRLRAHRQRMAEGRRLDDCGLLAILYYNRGVRALRSGAYAEAAGANLRALALDPQCQGARENLLGTINNWSLALAADGHRQSGHALLSAGLACAPDYAPFQANARFLQQSPAAGSVQDEAARH